MDDAGDTAGTPHQATPGRQRQRADVRQRMLVDAARQVIAERGLHATTVRDVAAAGSVAVGTVTYHFSGIDEVLARVLEAEMTSYSEPVMRAARAAPTGRAGLRTLVDGLVGSDRRAAEHWHLWLDFWTLAAHQDGYAAWQSEVYRELHGLAADLFARDLPDHAPASLAERAMELIALMDGLIVQCYLPEPRISPDQARRILHRHCRTVTTD